MTTPAAPQPAAPAAAEREHDGGPSGGDLAHGALRGAIAAMAMSGMRECTTALGLVKQTPPEAIFKQRARGLLRKAPRGRRKAAIELAHWSYGSAGGFVFALLPDGIRQRPWAGPGYGLAVWLGFELGIAPALGLSQSRKLRLAERCALAADHLLYGLVLAEFRERAPG